MPLGEFGGRSRKRSAGKVEGLEGVSFADIPGRLCGSSGVGWYAEDGAIEVAAIERT
jgi:hypothetical protein